MMSFIVIINLFLSGCNSTSTDLNTKKTGKETSEINKIIQNNEDLKPLERVYNVSLALNEVNFQVLSTGCTKSSDFKLLVKEMNVKQLIVSLIRENPDYCRAKSTLVTISKKLPKMKYNESVSIIVKNPQALKKKVP